MTFTVAHAQRADGAVCLQLAGELDMSTAPELNAVIDRLFAEGHSRILIDLAGLTFCDSTGIAVFVRGDNAAAALGGWLRLVGATGRVERVLRVTGLADVFRYDPEADPTSSACR